MKKNLNSYIDKSTLCKRNKTKNSISSPLTDGLNDDLLIRIPNTEKIIEEKTDNVIEQKTEQKLFLKNKRINELNTNKTEVGIKYLDGKITNYFKVTKKLKLDDNTCLNFNDQLINISGKILNGGNEISVNSIGPQLSNKTLKILLQRNILQIDDEYSDAKNSSKFSKDYSKLYFSNIKNKYCNKHKQMKEVERILSDLSMKEKYEGLLRRELILPPIYKLLLLQFRCLDKCILSLKFEKILPTTFKLINEEFIKNNFNNGISFEDFQKITYIAPIFFLYKYEGDNKPKRGKLDIIIDIPADFENRMKINYSEKKVYELYQLQSLEINKQIESRPSDESIKTRVEYIKNILLSMTIKQHEKQMKIKNIKFDPVEAGTWHSEFDLEGVTRIKTFTLFPYIDKTLTRV